MRERRERERESLAELEMREGCCGVGKCVVGEKVGAGGEGDATEMREGAGRKTSGGREGEEGRRRGGRDITALLILK